MNIQERFLGCLLGLACGDAVGTTVEFSARGSFPRLTGMIGGGPFNLQPGEWTDDTSMALCLAESLLECGGFNAHDQMDRYWRWYQEGYMSSNGICFDIGNTVRNAMLRYKSTGDPFSGSTDPRSAGNGSLMRLAPVPMYYCRDLDKAIRYSALSSQTTHAATEAVDACRLFALMLVLALRGHPKEAILLEARSFAPYPLQLSHAIHEIARGDYRQKPIPEIHGSGYVVKSLEAALWCFYTTESYREAILQAANLGDDADTTAAICGQLAGAYYGVQDIPADWLGILAKRKEIEAIANQLFLESGTTSDMDPSSV